MLVIDRVLMNGVRNNVVLDLRIWHFQVANFALDREVYRFFNFLHSSLIALIVVISLPDRFVLGLLVFEQLMLFRPIRPIL